MNQDTQELIVPKAYMLHTERELISPHVRILLTEVDILEPLPHSPSPPRKKHREQWWTEERLALLALGLGNTFFFALVLWWLM